MDPDVLEGLVDQLLDDDFLSFVENFTGTYCQLFTGGEEHSLRHTEIHEQYKRLYESRVEAYLKKAGVPLPVFVAACEDLARSDESYEILVSTLAALDDFQLFCDMMRAKAPSP